MLLKSPKVIIALTTVSLLLGACDTGGNGGGNGDASPSPTQDGPQVEITSVNDGDEIQGNTVNLGLTVTGDFEIIAADGDDSGESGHFHVFVDKEPVAAGEAIPAGDPNIIHSTDNPIVIPGLTIGTHELTVVLGNGRHERIGEASDEVSVEVTGPSIQATLDGPVTANQPFKISITTEDFTVVRAPEGKQEEKSGHFHILIDKPLPEFAKAIPADANTIHTVEKSVTINGLPSGSHTIFVVAGDGGHVPYRPLVAAKISFTIA